MMIQRRRRRNVALCWGYFVNLLVGYDVAARPLESLRREHWVPLDLTATDRTTDVATGGGGNMVYISGYQQAPPGVDGVQAIEALLMAYNSSGAQQWVVQYGTSGYDLGNSVAADATGVYLAGTARVVQNTTSSGGGDDGDDTDAFVVKYNSTGGLLWERSWGTSEPDMGNGVAVDDGSGLVYVVGTTRGSMGTDVLSPVVSNSATSRSDDAADATGLNAGASDVFLTCLGAEEGDIQWTVQFGSSDADAGNRVAVGPRGGVFLVGQLGDDGDASLAGARAFLAKYDYLGNLQFTARLNSSSTHFAVDLAPSLGSGGEGVVYVSGYTMGDSATMFLARFEGSAGTQTWLSHLGAETGSPHMAQSVTVIEGSNHDTFTARGVGSGSASDSGTGPNAPVVEDEGTENGCDARIVVVGYNTSAASADTHGSTGFAVAADTEGNWEWQAVYHEADRETAIAVSSNSRGTGTDSSVAFVVGQVSTNEASPGNYLFLDIQEVVRVSSPTPSPSLIRSETLRPTIAGSIGDASATTGLSQGASLWLLIIAPILVVVSCILMVGYVSKQCAIAFGRSPHTSENGGIVDYSHGDDHDRERARSSREILALRRAGSSGSSSGWRDSSPTSAGAMESGRRREGRQAQKGTAWPRVVANAFRDSDAGPPYRKLETKGRTRGRRGGGFRDDDGRGGGEVELHQATHHSTFSDSPRSEDGSKVRRGRTSSGDKGDVTSEASEHHSGRSADSVLRGAPRWESLNHSGISADEEATGSRISGNPRDDEPANVDMDSPSSKFDSFR